jgi:hypothetical protein
MDGTREKLAELIEDIYNQELQIRWMYCSRKWNLYNTRNLC